MTLTEVSYYSRKFAPVGIIVLLVLLIFIFGFRLLFLYLEIQSSAPTPQQQQVAAVPTNPVFGQITIPNIPNAKSSANYQYVLDTLDGTTSVENATSAAHVYFIPQQTASFGFLSKIYAMAKDVGIDTDVIEHRLEDKTAVFDDGKRNLRIDIRTFNFTYNYKITEDDNLEITSTPELDGVLETQGSSFLSAIDRYPEVLAQGNQNIMYMRLEPQNNQVTTLDSAAGANMAEVDFFPQDVNGFPVVTSSYYNSANYVILLLGNREYLPVRAQVAYFEKSIDQIGTYPLRTAEQAWSDLQAGQGVVVSSSTDGGQVKIQKVFLAYYEPDTYQEYQQPVYVFLGENRFAAYVPAVSSDFLLP